MNRDLRNRLLMGIALLLLLYGCENMNRARDEFMQQVASVETPRVRLQSLRIMPPSGAEQRLELLLSVVNPNSFTLDVKGMLIEVGFNGDHPLRGVTGEVQPVAAYSEATVPVSVTTDLAGGERLLRSVREYPDEALAYRLEARLDLRRVGGKRITVLNQGEISAQPPAPAAEAH